MRGIYIIICLANSVVYVGESVNMPQRLYEHRMRLRRGAHENPRLQNAWNKHGEDAFEFRPFHAMPGSTEAERLHVEGVLMKLLAPTFNLQPPGVPPSQRGKVWTPEQRARLSAALKGKRKSPEHRAKIAANNRASGKAKRGVPLTQEHKAAIAVGMSKRDLTPELRAKFSRAAHKMLDQRRKAG